MEQDMTARKTIEYFSYYLVLMGLGITFAPALMTALIFLPPPADSDYLFIGFLAVLLGYYYWRMSRDDNVAFFQATVIGRLAIFGATLAWVVFAGLAPNYLILLAVDAAGALWTAKALKAGGEAAVRIV